MARPQDPFDAISPLDYRYWDPGVAKFLSENGFTRYKLKVELAIVRTLHARGLCTEAVVHEVEQASARVTTAEVYDEEDRINHDIRALVNRIREKVSDVAKPFIHMTATSYCIVDTANAARFRDVVLEVLIPALMALEGELIQIAKREADTAQIGRTHGQHAVPITFGFAIASYVSRIGGCIETLGAQARQLRGKFSGAVGAYNASSLFFKDPEAFEAEVSGELNLQPAEHSTQIVPPEAMTRLFSEVTITAGILANLGDDMRHLQRTEIGEVGEEFKADQVGSSTMPQKRNPINFENGKSCWKIVMPRLITVFLDQISEHQRDLTNSASARTYGEMIAYLVSMTKRFTKTMKKLVVDHPNMERNLNLQRGGAAEPLYIMLAAMGHPDAHEAVRQLTLQADRTGQRLEDIMESSPEVGPYLQRMAPHQRDILAHPSLYVGIAPQKARDVAERWRKQFSL